ncbi:MAG: hypothetical protein ACLFQK_08165 [Fibrobacterota bacterium]
MEEKRKKRAEYSALFAFIEQEYDIISKTFTGLDDLLLKKAEELNCHEVRAEAMYIHDFYNSVENIFKFIAEELNGGIPKGESWHKTLLIEMKSDIPSIRKRIISNELYGMLEEILKFRHIVRNSYGIYLKSVRVRKISVITKKAAEQIKKEISLFIKNWYKQV